MDGANNVATIRNRYESAIAKRPPGQDEGNVQLAKNRIVAFACSCGGAWVSANVGTADDIDGDCGGFQGFLGRYVLA